MFKVTITLILLLLLTVCLVGTAILAGQVHSVTADTQFRPFPGGTDNAASVVLANATTVRLDVLSESGS